MKKRKERLKRNQIHKNTFTGQTSNEWENTEYSLEGDYYQEYSEPYNSTDEYTYEQNVYESSNYDGEYQSYPNQENLEDNYLTRRVNPKDIYEDYSDEETYIDYANNHMPYSDINQNYDDNQDKIEFIDTTTSYKKSIFRPRLKKPNFIVSVMVNVVRLVVIIILLSGLAGLGAILGIAKAYVETAPNLDLALISDQDQTSFFYDSQGQLITEYKGIENRRMVPISSMPDYLKQAFIAVEDARFYSHSGIDLKRIAGAFISNFSTGGQQGGSTITQQLIKQTVLSSELSYKRKIQEAFLAIQLEGRYSKEEILEYYLNTIYLGEDYYGVQVAAEGYFGKNNLGGLTLRECAMLAGATTNPYYYNPRRNLYKRNEANNKTDYISITNNRTNYVLHRMYENQFITYQQYVEATDPQTAQVLENDPNEGKGMYAHAHYIEYAVKEIVDTFIEIEGLENTPDNRAAMENKLRTGGYHIRLAMDSEIQNIVEDTIENWDKYPRLRDPKDSVVRAKNADGTYSEIIQPQVAAAVLDYRTGEIKAIVGSRTKPTQRKTLNRAADLHMPVGSTIKPIGVYGPAIELGGSPASVVYNIPVPIPGWESKKGYPENYGGGGHVGPETLREALTKSHNTAAAQALMTMVGVDNSVEFMRRLGVNTENIDKTPFGVSLGSSGLTPLEMTVAFGVLANAGEYQKPLSFLGISDNKGNVVYDSHANQQRGRVFKPSTAWLVVDIMKDVVSKGTGKTARISGQTVAGKTGTNTDQKGVSFVGMTGYYSSYIWVGHDNYKALSSKTTGNNSVAPIWKEIMEKIHKSKNLPNREILEGDPENYNLVKVTTCKVSGQLATAACRNDILGKGVVTDYWPKDSVPQIECQMHRDVVVCTQSNKQATQYCPEVYVSNKGVIIIPPGHPLYPYTSSHKDIIKRHLGEFATVQSNDDYVVCDIHGPFTDQEDYFVESTFIPDAKMLLDQAEIILNTLEPESENYNTLQGAIINLQNIISQPSPSTEFITEGMTYLTGVMVAVR